MKKKYFFFGFFFIFWKFRENCVDHLNDKFGQFFSEKLRRGGQVLAKNWIPGLKPEIRQIGDSERQRLWTCREPKGYGTV